MIFYIKKFANKIHGRNFFAASICVKSALIFPKQTIRWSSKHIKCQLQKIREKISTQAQQQDLI